MVRPGLRSRSRKRVARRTPGGISRIYYVRRKYYEAHCAVCGKPLGGVPRDYKLIRWGPKTAKRPERYFGGVVCPKCLATMLKLSIRGTTPVRGV